MARPKKPTDELKDQRVPIMMSEDELKAIDDWRFANRVASRGDAIRRLCQIGLKTSEVSDALGDSSEKLSVLLTQIFEDAFPLDRSSDMNAEQAIQYIVEIERLSSNLLINLGGVFDAADAMLSTQSTDNALEHLKRLKTQYAEYLAAEGK